MVEKSLFNPRIALSYNMDRQLGKSPPKTYNHFFKKKLPHGSRQNSKTLYEDRWRLGIFFWCGRGMHMEIGVSWRKYIW